MRDTKERNPREEKRDKEGYGRVCRGLQIKRKDKPQKMTKQGETVINQI